MRAAPPEDLKRPEHPVSRADFLREVETWAKRIGARPRRITVRAMKLKWGSFSTAGRVTFDAALLCEHAEFRKRVIIEELLHLRVPGHGKLFKALLAAHLGCKD